MSTLAPLTEITTAPISRAGAGLPRSQGRHGDHDGTCGTDATRAEPGASLQEALVACLGSEGLSPRPEYGPLAITLMANELRQVAKAMMKSPVSVSAKQLACAIEDLMQATAYTHNRVSPHANNDLPHTVSGRILDLLA